MSPSCPPSSASISPADNFNSPFNTERYAVESRQLGDVVVAGQKRLSLQMIESPVGILMAGACEDGLAMLKFVDSPVLENNLGDLQRSFSCQLNRTHHPVLDTLDIELRDYFAGRRIDFSISMMPEGTDFQKKVWSELRRIPYGKTISYEELACRIGRPTAQRAVANANRQNPIAILVPCHRVIGKDGSLTGYAGGLDRKRQLLALEKQ